MNHQCHGRFFTTQGVRYYCCGWDRALTTATVQNGEVCPNCQRPIIGSEETVTAVEVQVKMVLRMSSGSAVTFKTETLSPSGLAEKLGVDPWKI